MPRGFYTRRSQRTPSSQVDLPQKHREAEPSPTQLGACASHTALIVAHCRLALARQWGAYARTRRAVAEVVFEAAVHYGNYRLARHEDIQEDV